MLGHHGRQGSGELNISHDPIDVNCSQIAGSTQLVKILTHEDQIVAGYENVPQGTSLSIAASDR